MKIAGTLSFTGIQKTQKFSFPNKIQLKKGDNAENAQKADKDSMDADAKALIIAMRIIKGDKVPPKDEKFLAEHNPKLYFKAKMLGELAKNKNSKEHDSILEDEDSEETEADDD
ncbi:MAG: hypothetical protein LBC85_09275 [Fibromonadaceae bacterium]|jgi:hypothetical protein|nr:hypothetical protein [Fibromonadaceae bacterium]